MKSILRTCAKAKHSLAPLLVALSFSGAALAANPVNTQNARTEVSRIHRSTIRQVAEIVGKPESFVATFVNRPEAGRMSEQVELTGRQHRELRRIVGEHNLRAREAYEQRGIHPPSGVELQIEF